METQMDRRSQVKTASGLNIIAGLWLVISPWIYGYNAATGTTGVWNSVIVGLLIALFAAIRAFGSTEDAWLSWINLLLGVWVLISPWIYGYSDSPSRMWNSIVVGVVVALLSLWSALATPTHRTTTA